MSHPTASPTALTSTDPTSTDPTSSAAALPTGAVVPTASVVPVLRPVPGDPAELVPSDAPRPELTLVRDEDGSLVAEYGLLAVVAATVAGVLIAWSRGGALNDFFGALLDHARNIVIG